jgi:laminin alpha 3/5
MASRGSAAPLAALGFLRPFVLFLCLIAVKYANTAVLTPPYFNLAQGRNITATATCGENVPGPELFCRLTGATGSEDQTTREVIRGQLCDHCNPNNPSQRHPTDYAVDGTERFWMSPPLSRGTEYNKINFTIHLGQVKMERFFFLSLP